MTRKQLVLVKLRATENFICIRTRTRDRESPWSFDLPRTSLADLEAERHIVAKSGYSFAELRLDDAGTEIRIDFAWLSPCGDGELNGFAQTVVLDYRRLALFVQESLSSARIITTGAAGYPRLYRRRQSTKTGASTDAPVFYRTRLPDTARRTN